MEGDSYLLEYFSSKIMIKAYNIHRSNFHFIYLQGCDKDDLTDSNWDEDAGKWIMEHKYKSQFISEQLLWRIVNAKTLFPKSL